MTRMFLTVHHKARKSPMSLDELRINLTENFSDYFGKGTLSRTPSDAYRRVLLVDKLVNRADQIRTGQPITPIWN
jgi:hypothetical protein